MTQIAIAFDVPTLADALALDEKLGRGDEVAKVGLELFVAEGPEAVRALRARGRRVFLDLKLHDIPNTVKGAAKSAARLGAEFLTVHATGGERMIAAAAEGIREGGGGTKILAVTVLTSLDANAMPPGFQSPFDLPSVIARLATMAITAGAYGIVCAAPDLPDLRAKLGGSLPFAVTPGVRPAGAPTQDQQRVTTIAEAVAMGSGMVVLGRAITSASDPRTALDASRAVLRDAKIRAGAVETP